MATTQPFRATLSHRLPVAPLMAPKGRLDMLELSFRDREDSVLVVSAATNCSATYWCAAGDGCLTTDDPVAGGPGEVSLTPAELDALDEVSELADEWDSAVKEGDAAVLARLARRIEGIGDDVYGLRLTVAR